MRIRPLRPLARPVLSGITALLIASVPACKGGETDSGSGTPAGGAPAASAAARNANANKVTAAGSSALLPLAKAAADVFEQSHPGVTVEVTAGGSGQGLSQVEAGAVDIGDSDIPAKAGMSDLVDHEVAVVVFAIVANKGPFDAQVQSLTKDQAVGIFTGKITNWKEIGGGDQPITVLNRPKGSGTRAVFSQVVLGGDRLVEGTAVEDNSGTIRRTLGQIPGSVSYLATSYVDESIKAFGYDGAMPTEQDVTAAKYPIYSYEHMFTKGEAKGAVKGFLDFFLTPEVQNGLVKHAGYLPVGSVKAAQ